MNVLGQPERLSTCGSSGGGNDDAGCRRRKGAPRARQGAAAVRSESAGRANQAATGARASCQSAGRTSRRAGPGRQAATGARAGKARHQEGRGGRAARNPRLGGQTRPLRADAHSLVASSGLVRFARLEGARSICMKHVKPSGDQIINKADRGSKPDCVRSENRSAAAMVVVGRGLETARGLGSVSRSGLPRPGPPG